MSWIAAVSSQNLAVKQTFATPHAKITSALLQKSDYQRESEQELYNCAMAGKGDEERPRSQPNISSTPAFGLLQQSSSPSRLVCKAFEAVGAPENIKDAPMAAAGGIRSEV